MAYGGGMTQSKHEVPVHFFSKVAETALGRARGWHAIAWALEEPDLEFAEDLRSGKLGELWTEAAAWLGDDRHMLTSELMSLGVFARGAARREADDDLAQLHADWAVAIGDDNADAADAADAADVDVAVVASRAALIESIHCLVRLCEREAAAWQGRDLSAGKELRASQDTFISANIAEQLTGTCVRILEAATLNIWRVLARLMLAYLSADTGRDYQRAAVGPKRKSGGLIDEKGFLRLYEQT